MSNEITITGSDHLIVQSKPEVLVKGAIVLERNGKQLCSIDATYDFESIQDDPELVAIAIQLVQHHRTRVSMAI